MDEQKERVKMKQDENKNNVYHRFKMNLGLHLTRSGGLAQLARAPALHAGGQRFESVILHSS